VKNKLVLTAQNIILWNGAAIKEGDLVTFLEATKAMNPEPELQFQPEEYASYDDCRTACCGSSRRSR